MRSSNNSSNNNNNAIAFQIPPEGTFSNNNNNEHHSKSATTKQHHHQQQQALQKDNKSSFMTEEEKKKKDKNDKLRNREEEIVRLAKLDLDRMDFPLRMKKGDRGKGTSAERVGELVMSLIQEQTEEKALNALKELERYENGTYMESELVIDASYLGPLKSCKIILNTCAIEEVQLEDLKKRYKESNEATVKHTHTHTHIPRNKTLICRFFFFSTTRCWM